MTDDRGWGEDNTLQAGSIPVPKNKMKKTFSTKKKWVSTDAWRGYEQPIYAVAGSSDTGSWEDSPCPTCDVNKEMDMVKKELAEAGIPTKQIVTPSSNVFMGKRWLIAPKENFPQVKKKSKEVLKKLLSQTKFIHDAD
jgi:hypothetical protein